MIVVVGCLAYAVIVTTAAPMVLTHGTWQVWRPRLALASWHAAVLTAAAAAVAALGRSFGIAAGHRTDQSVDTSVAITVTVAVWIALVAFAALMAFLLAHGERIVRLDAAHRLGLDQGVHARQIAVEIHGRLVVRFLDSTHPAAYSFRAPEPTIVLTTGIRDLLSEDELDSVIEHERAHLDQHHHLAIMLSILNSRLVPRWAPAAKMEPVTRFLAELIADDRAAKVCGPQVTANALAKMATVTDTSGLTTRSVRLLSLADLTSHQPS